MKRFDQTELNDLVRDLDLSKEKAELLASRLKEKSSLSRGTKITLYRTRERSFLNFFTQEENLVYCNNIEGLINQFQSNLYCSKDWRLFIDSSSQSLKAVLLHSTNKYPPIPIAYSVVLKEEYHNMQYLLEKIKYI